MRSPVLARGPQVASVFDDLIRAVGVAKPGGARSCPGQVVLWVGPAAVTVRGRWHWDDQLDLFTTPVELRGRSITVRANLRDAVSIRWDGGAIEVCMDEREEHAP